MQSWQMKVLVGIPEPKNVIILVVTVTGKGDNPKKKNIYIYIYLEPVCPLFLALTPSKTRSKLQSKQWSFGFQVYVYIYIHLQVDIQKVSHANTGRGRAMMGLEISCLFLFKKDVFCSWGDPIEFQVGNEMIIVYWMYGSQKNMWRIHGFCHLTKAYSHPAFVKALQLIFSVLGYPETETVQCLPKKLGVGRPFTTSCQSWNMWFQEVSSTLIHRVLDGGRMKKSFCSMFILPFTGFLHLRVVSRISSSNSITHFWKYSPLLWETIQSNLTTFRKPNISPPFRDIIVHSLVAIYWMCLPTVESEG